MNTQSLVTDINDDVVTVRQGDRLSGSTRWRMCWRQNWWPPKAEEGAAYGAGILAMVGVGAYPSLAVANACVPLAGAIVDVWHCDATGAYSDVADRRANTLGQKFLRGAQITDADGTVEFTAIYPGWYPGRAVHIHFKIRGGAAANQSYEFTSQLYFDDALSDRIYTQAPYSTRGQRTTRNQNDGIFRSGGDRLMLPVSQDGEGYAGRFEIGLELD